MGPHSSTRNTVQSLVTFLPNIIAQHVLPRATGTDGSSGDLEVGEHFTHCQEEFDGLRGLCQAAGNKLTDDALLDIFDFYLEDNNRLAGIYGTADKWHTLVHVCRRWRDLVFASPCRLNLRLLCRKDTPVREMLDIWPALPIEIHDDWTGTWDVGLENIVAALEHPDRVRYIYLGDVPSSVGEALAAAMQVPFPELTHLWLWSDGGSAPRLRILSLRRISFPALPNLLLSASDLVHLYLTHLPHLGYISPEAMIAYLSSLN
ncbi:hypothetical protein BC826DRAFT_1188274, partial [Russula brevipes]